MSETEIQAGAACDARNTLMVQKKFYDFLRNFRADSVFKYREALTQNYRRHDSLVIVELADVAAFDTELLTSLQKRPDFQLRLFEAAARDVLQRSVLPSIERHHAFDVQLALQSTQLSTPLRSLTAEHVGRLLKVSGIIVSASKVRSKAVKLDIQSRVPCLLDQHVDESD
jgi:DNA replication licensing factor MCM5